MLAASFLLTWSQACDHDDSNDGNDPMRLITTAYAAMLATISFLVTTPASAGHNSPLYEAATDYRAAVRHFERAVLRAPCFDRQHERIVDRLEDATSRLRSAARRPDYLYQLQITWNEIQSLQHLVAKTIFGHPFCPVGGELVVRWDRVVQAGAVFAGQLALMHCDVPRYGAPRLPIYGVSSHHHHDHGHHDHGRPDMESHDQKPLPYWHPSRTQYGQGIDVPKQDLMISAPTLVPRDSRDRRKVTPAPRNPSGVQIQRTPKVVARRGISSTPSPRKIGSVTTGAMLMRR